MLLIFYQQVTGFALYSSGGQFRKTEKLDEIAFDVLPKIDLI